MFLVNNDHLIDNVSVSPPLLYSGHNPVEVIVCSALVRKSLSLKKVSYFRSANDCNKMRVVLSFRGLLSKFICLDDKAGFFYSVLHKFIDKLVPYKEQIYR